MKTINILLIILLAAGSLLAGDNIITLSNGKGLPGSTDNVVAIHLANQDTVRGMQFRLIDNCDYISVDTVWTETIKRPQVFSYNYYKEINTTEIILLQSKSRLITPLNNEIIFISYSISKDAPAGNSYDLQFEEVTVSDVENAKLSYQLVDSNFLIEGSTSAVEDDAQIATTYTLENNYPNPFNPVTRIQFSVPNTEFVSLGIYNALGQKVRTLVANQVQAGQHSVVWNGTNDLGNQVPSGVYFYRIQAGSFNDTKTLTLMK